MTSEQFAALMRRMTQAICTGDGAAAAACFVEEGIYHDGFYGEFCGRAAIAGMVCNFFHRDARDFEWRLRDPVCEGEVGYVAYDFSYVSKIAGSAGRRAGFSGIARCRLAGALLQRYEEVFERAPVLVALGFSDERILKSIRRWSTV